VTEVRATPDGACSDCPSFEKESARLKDQHTEGVVRDCRRQCAEREVPRMKTAVPEEFVSECYWTDQVGHRTPYKLVVRSPYQKNEFQRGGIHVSRIKTGCKTSNQAA
jgi:hypothetical protein